MKNNSKNGLSYNTRVQIGLIPIKQRKSTQTAFENITQAANASITEAIKNDPVEIKSGYEWDYEDLLLAKIIPSGIRFFNYASSDGSMRANFRCTPHNNGSY